MIKEMVICNVFFATPKPGIMFAQYVNSGYYIRKKKVP